MMRARHIRSALYFGMLLAVDFAQACAICGLNKSFSPKMLFISLGFVLLPMSFAAWIAWRVWKDAKRQARPQREGPPA